MAYPPLFDGINDIDAATARRRFQESKLSAGTVLFQAGTRSGGLALVVSGRLEVRIGDALLAALKPGEMVGEMALFEEGESTADVVAAKDSEVWVLNRRGYEELRDTLHPICQRIEAKTIQGQVERLRVTGRRVARLGLGEPSDHAPSSGFFASVKSLFGVGGVTDLEGDSRAALESSSLFNGSPPAVLDQMEPYFRRQRAAKGHFLCTEGQVGDNMFVLSEGTVDVVAAAGDDPRLLVTLHPGAAFGMVALASSNTRMASCVAGEGAVVHELDQHGWNQLIAEPYMTGSSFRRAVIRAFSDQQRYSNQQLAAFEEARSEDLLKEASRGAHSYEATVRGS